MTRKQVFCASSWCSNSSIISGSIFSRKQKEGWADIGARRVSARPLRPEPPAPATTTCLWLCYIRFANHNHQQFLRVGQLRRHRLDVFCAHRFDQPVALGEIIAPQMIKLHADQEIGDIGVTVEG